MSKEDFIFRMMQENRTHSHPNFNTTKRNESVAKDNNNTNNENNNNNNNNNNNSFQFIVMADTQFGILTDDQDWTKEMEYSKRAVTAINEMIPRPLFCCICGDLVNMTSSIYANTRKPSWAQQKQQQQQQQEQQQEQHRENNTTSTSSNSTSPNDDTDNNSNMLLWTEEECMKIQERQYNDFKRIWSTLHKDIALVCVCGNHDVGNQPTSQSIQIYNNQFGNDYLSFWAKNTFCIVLNSSLFNDPTQCKNEYENQLIWLTNQLESVQQNSNNYNENDTNNSNTKPDHVFVFLHHPLFIYNQDEEPNDLIGTNTTPNGATVSDGYFPLPKQYRNILLQLFQKYNVSATFAGHFHQNMVSYTNNMDMEMIITSSLSLVLQSTGPAQYYTTDSKTIGYRIVTVDDVTKQYHHRFVSLSSS